MRFIEKKVEWWFPGAGEQGMWRDEESVLNGYRVLVLQGEKSYGDWVSNSVM